jgi:hypothetical protein
LGRRKRLDRLLVQRCHAGTQQQASRDHRRRNKASRAPEQTGEGTEAFISHALKSSKNVYLLELAGCRPHNPGTFET